MKYSIAYDKKALKFVNKLGGVVKKQITKKLTSISQGNPKLSIYKMRAGDDNVQHYRVRVGNFRVVYRVVDGKMIILVVDIGNRDSVYDKF